MEQVIDMSAGPLPEGNRGAESGPAEQVAEAGAAAAVHARPAEPWEEAKAMLRRDFGIESAFVRVKALAKVLGVSQALVYLWIREDRFFLPVRKLDSAAVVKLEDLARWYCGPGGGPEAFGPAPTEEERIAAREERKRAKRARDKEAADRIVARSLERLGMEQEPRGAVRRRG
jgi:hypothetical protein